MTSEGGKKMAILKVVIDIGPPKREFWLRLERGAKLNAETLKRRVMQAANIHERTLRCRCGRYPVVSVVVNDKCLNDK